MPDDEFNSAFEELHRAWEERRNARRDNKPRDEQQEDWTERVRRARAERARRLEEQQQAKPNGSAKPPLPLQWINMFNWDNEPPPSRRWSILNRAPANQAGLFSGEGGTGKSIIELMKDVAHVAGKDWLGSMPEFGPAFYLGAEDEVDEIHRRLDAIAAHYGVTYKQLIEGGLHALCLLGKDATLCAAAGKSGKVETTALYKQIYEAAGDIKPKNISIDTLSRAFVGSEIDRVQVHGFATHMQALAMITDGGAVTVLSHPSLAGIASGSGISGSTGWHGAFRFRQYLKGCKQTDDEPDDDLRELEFKKNQYGPKGETLVLRYQRGLFLPVVRPSTLEKAAREAKADVVFLKVLRRFTEQGRNVSDKPKANGYAPREFTAEPEGKEFRLSEMEDAMRRLFTAGRIRMQDYGRPSRPISKIVEAGA
jgi:RecA-family ATPase